MPFYIKINIVWFFIVLFWIPGLSHGGRESAREPLVVSLDQAWPPFSFVDEGGRPKGMLIELWQDMGRLMGRHVVFVLSDWAESMAAVREGRAHVHGGLIPSPERREFFDFSADFMPVHAYAFAASGIIPFKLELPEQGEVGITLGSYELEFMQSEYPHMKLRSFPNNEAMVMAALRGEVELFVADYPTGMYLLDRYGQPGQFYAVQFLYTRHLAAGMPTGHSELQGAIDGALATFSDDELRRISQRWLRSERVEVLPDWLLPLLGGLLFFLCVAGGSSYVLALGLQRRKLLRDVSVRTEALRESEARFRTLADSAASGIYVLQDRYFVLVNAAMGHILGYTEAELLSLDVSVFVHPDHREMVMQRAMDRQEGREAPRRYEMKMLRKDGEIRWVELSAGRTFYGGRASSTGTLFDVTERKELEEKLREREETFRMLVENANDIIFSLNTSGILSYVSPNWTEILGHDVGEVMGRSFTRFIHPDDLPVCHEFLKLIYDTGQKQGGITYRVRHKNGGWRWHTSNASPCMDREGKIAGVQGIARDITEVRSAAQSREASLSMLNKLAANIPGTIYQFRIRPDGSYHFPFISERVGEVFGLQPDDVMEDALPVFDAMHPDDLGYVLESILDSAACLSPWKAEFRAHKGDGHFRWFSGQSLPELQEDGGILWYGYFADIQEWKDAEERITRMALYDSLTGLPNRALFEDRVNQALIQGERENAAFALLFVDLDRFKPINDTLGHRVGDLLLQQLAGRMEKMIRASDTAARIGGDEFVILLRRIVLGKDAIRIAETMCREIRKAFFIEGHELHVSASIGIALYPDHGEDLITLCKRADQAMYGAKAGGRDRVFLYEGEQHCAESYETN
ncbi:PAS domain S-box protein [Desulfobotulus sp. H1]|uniref:PAS domain S-box protein n=1 Tax=Desulfobotulus pelophilus TaxID=2823377 RepID=A0ABT3N9Z0_9BACT|nr:PAS domain S-box protein [Desulfobotulus pelophilus]MCW7754282.1 PAS domain S-box protein [Desulfobotulus pelophilus]